MERGAFLALNWLFFALAVACAAAGAAFLASRDAPARAEAWLERLFAGRKGRAAALAAALLPAAAAAASKLAQYANFQSIGDSAIQLNAAWSFVHGHDLHSSMLGRPLFADHIRLLLPLYAPVLLLWESAAAFALVHGLALGLAVPAVYLLARRRVDGVLLPGLLAVAAAAHPVFLALVTTALEDGVLAPALFLWAAYLWESGRRGWATLLALLLLGAKEQAPFVFLGLGALLLLRRGRAPRLWGAALAAASVALFLLESRLMREALATVTAPSCPKVYIGWNMYAHLGGETGLGGLLGAALSRPGDFARALVWPPAALDAPLRALASLAFLPLLAGPALLPALAAWAPHQLAVPGTSFHDLRAFYGGFVLGPLLWAGAIGLGRAARRLDAAGRRRLMAFLSLAAACGFWSQAGSYRAGLLPSSWRRSVPAVLARVGPDDAVWCDAYLTPHLALRRRVKALPGAAPDCYFDSEGFAPDKVVLSTYWTRLAAPDAVSRVSTYLREGGYTLAFQDEDLLLFAAPGR